MSVIVVRPTSVVSGSAYFKPTGAASVLAAINDNSDASYIRKDVAGMNSARLVLNLADPTIPAGHFINHVAPFCRYKSANSNQHFLRAYKTGDWVQSWNAWYALNTSTITNIEPGYTPREWAVADLTALALNYYDYDTISLSTRAYLYELGASVYTIQNATTFVWDRTEATSAFATFPVDITCTVDDWQAAAPYGDPVRTVTLEVRVESGGSGVGTGTLVATRTVDVVLQATAGTDLTHQEQVTLDVPLSNAEYNVYARSIRHRWDETTPTTEQYGAWSAAGTLTMSAPLPDAPILCSASVWDPGLGIPYSITEVQFQAVPTTGYTEITCQAQRSRDGGVTWEWVHNGEDVGGSLYDWTSFLDFEPAYGTETLYRMRTIGLYSGVAENIGEWTEPFGVTVPVSGWNLKCPEMLYGSELDPDQLAVFGLDVVGDPEEELTEDIGVFRPLGRRYPITVAGKLGGWDGTLAVHTITEAKWLVLKGMLEAQKVLLLESAFGGSKYIRVINGAKLVRRGTRTEPRRDIGLQYVEVEHA